jgi:hypothetical protein
MLWVYNAAEYTLDLTLDNGPKAHKIKIIVILKRLMTGIGLIMYVILELMKFNYEW